MHTCTHTHTHTHTPPSIHFTNYGHYLLKLYTGTYVCTVEGDKTHVLTYLMHITHQGIPGNSMAHNRTHSHSPTQLLW